MSDKSKRLDMKAMFSRGFVCIMVALLSWSADNMACGFLQSLPVYPQLHAIGWCVNRIEQSRAEQMMWLMESTE